MRRTAIVLLLALGGIAHAGGGGDDDDPMARGKKLLKAGKTKDACDAFGEAEHATPGGAAATALADCDAQLGKLGSAWHYYKEAGDDAKAKKVAAKAAKLTLTVKPADAKVRVFANGMDASVALTEPMPVDSGDLVVAASAPGFAVWRKTVTIADGDDQAVAVKLARATGVAKLDPNDPDEPDAVMEKKDDGVTKVGPPPPVGNQIRAGGDAAFEFAQKNSHITAHVGYAYKQLVEASVLVGARTYNGLFTSVGSMGIDTELGGGADVRGYIPFGGFCKPTVHASGTYWSTTGFVIAVGGGVACQDGPHGIQLGLGFDQELGADHSRGVVVGVGHPI